MKIKNQNRPDTKYSLVYICSPLRPVSPDVSVHPDELKANLRLACDACTFAAVRGFYSGCTASLFSAVSG